MKKIVELIETVKEHHFSSELLFKDSTLYCNCSGLVTFILTELQRTPSEFVDKAPKASQYFDYFSKRTPKRNISELIPYDCLVWKKDNIPKSGDSGHILIILQAPLLSSSGVYTCKVLDVTKETGLKSREIELHVTSDGLLWGVRWSDKLKKVKKTEILGYSLFKRRVCDKCELPEKRCLCSILPSPPKKSPPIVILRHPSERKHPFATWPLLNHFFADLKTVVGEKFDPIEGTLVYPEHPLFPTRTESQINTSPYILIDATWKKSKKILFLNPWLSELPRVSLNLKSSYQIRNQPQEGHLSTLEAYRALWAQLEPERKQEQALLSKVFDKFNEDQKNYSS